MNELLFKIVGAAPHRVLYYQEEVGGPLGPVMTTFSLVEATRPASQIIRLLEIADGLQKQVKVLTDQLAKTPDKEPEKAPAKPAKKG